MILYLIELNAEASSFFFFNFILEIDEYLTRDYNDGFINDRVKYGSGKI